MEDEGILDVDTRTRMTRSFRCGNPSSNLEVPAMLKSQSMEILKLQMCFIFYRGADTLSCKFSIRLARRFSDLEYR